MDSSKDLSSELLKQNGLHPGRVSEDDRARFRQILAQDEARVQRTKWAALVSWALFLGAAVFIPPVLNRASETGAVGLLGLLMVLAVAMSWSAIIFTISWFLRSRSLGRRQILAKLTDIEAQLARLGRDEGPKDAPGDGESQTDEAARG